MLPFQPSPTHQHPLSYMKMRGGLYEDEYFWRDHQAWLAESGYLLRPRYRKDWEPSWLKSKKFHLLCEDGKGALRNKVMDAVRTSDRRIVFLKQVNKSYCPWEEGINRMFTMSGPLASDRHNCVAPVYEVLQSPLDKDIIILVMPYLMRIKGVRFATVGEGVECIRQLLEGLQFLHRNNLAHCDIHINNVMMDPAPLFSELPHPVHPHKSYDFKRRVTQHTRTSHPTKYYYIDFGLSHLCPPTRTDASPLIRVSFGGDKTVPEYEEPSVLRDPYKIDVYCLGNLIQIQFMGKNRHFDVFKPLLAEMTRHDPGARPSIDEALAHFERLRGSLTSRALRSRVVYKRELGIPWLCRACRHLIRTLYWDATNTPALPTPKN